MDSLKSYHKYNIKTYPKILLFQDPYAENFEEENIGDFKKRAPKKPREPKEKKPK